MAARLLTPEDFSAACPGRCTAGPPIMAGLTPSPDISPVSAATTNGLFPRDSFCLNLSSLPDASSFMLKSALRSPHLLESPNGLYFGSGGLSNSYRKRPRNMSQSSGTDREMSTNGTPPATNQAGAPSSTISNGTSSEPRPPNKKRPSTDTIDYPRRRATIAVLQHAFSLPLNTDNCSVRFVGPGSHDATAQGRNAGFVQNSTQNAFTGNRVLSWTQATN